MALRVVGAGLGRTGTNSLMTALEQLLGGPCHHMYKVFVNEEAETWRAIGRSSGDEQAELLAGVLADYVAAVDWPAAAYWERLAADNPDALIVLSVRDSGEQWFKSASDTIFPAIDASPDSAWKEMVTELVLKKFAGGDLTDQAACIAAYEAHNAYVRANADPARLLEWRATDGWEPICARLGLPVPEEPFPHTNSTREWVERRQSD